MYLHGTTPPPSPMNRTLLTTACALALATMNAQICDVTITYQVNGFQVQYNGSSPDNPAQWSWFFNGGTPMTSNLQNPVVTYSAAGQYICALTVSGGPNSCSASLSQDLDTVVILSTLVPEIASNGLRIELVDGSKVEVENGSSEPVLLEVLDLGGKRVGILFSGVLQTGRTTLPMDHLGLPRGMYLLTVTGAQGRLARRFVVD